MTAVKKTAAKAAPKAAPKAVAAKTAAATKQVEAAVAAGKESVETAVKAGTEVATKNYKNYEKVVSMTKDQVEAAVQAGSDAFKNYEEFAAFGQANVDAVVQSGSVLVKGLQDLNKTWFDLAQASMEMNVSGAKALFACKDAGEALKVQTEVAQKGYERMMADSRKVSDLSVKLATDVTAPFVGQFNKAVATMTKAFPA